jgi:hypothetical protein
LDENTDNIELSLNIYSTKIWREESMSRKLSKMACWLGWLATSLREVVPTFDEID